MKIGILNYKACNLASVFHTIYNIGHDPFIIENKEDLNKAQKIIIPGVGSAAHCMSYLEKKGFIDELQKYKNKGISILGICLGMQIFSKKLTEHGVSEGLGFINGEVIPINNKTKFNIGWCNVDVKNSENHNIIESNKPFFFCHSYYLSLNKADREKYVFGKISLNKEIPSIIIRENIMGVQFHPEKSQANGIKLLNFFIDRFK